jgi:hypothetical protein
MSLKDSLGKLLRLRISVQHRRVWLLALGSKPCLPGDEPDYQFDSGGTQLMD